MTDEEHKAILQRLAMRLDAIDAKLETLVKPILDGKRSANAERQARFRERVRNAARNAKVTLTGAKRNGRRNAIVTLDETPIVITIPLIGDRVYEVRKSLADELEKLYPAVDVPQTLRELRGWNLTHASQRKTAGGILKHINGWFAREQNKG